MILLNPYIVKGGEFQNYQNVFVFYTTTINVVSETPLLLREYSPIVSGEDMKLSYTRMRKF